ncbi:MAG: tRNA lysidine(34) synthetase TilS [Chitinophagaceae bacterium]|nr:tRNA lysidine(34) synthetase TilS [Chitinophagaceae bacterium]
MPLSHSFQKFVDSNHLFTKPDKLLLAVSGGVDSVVLTDLFFNAGFDFVIAHCNFQLRGEESERDEAFVTELGKKYRKETIIKRFETGEYARENKLSIQEAARQLRYDWFHELIDNSKQSAGGSRQSSVSSQQSSVSSTPIHHSPPDSYRDTIHHIVTAHHLDDNIETVLMNFFKGTGIAGLRGMLPLQGKIVRPLLFARKGELLAYAKENGLKWVEDSSNTEDKYSRNYFRNQFIPLLQKIYPEAENNLADNLKRFRDAELLYRQAIEWHKKKLLEYKGDEVHIPALKLKKSEPLHSIVYEIISVFQFTPGQVEEVIKLLDSETGKYILSPTHRILKNRNWIVISPVNADEPQHILIEQGDSNVQCSAFNIQCSISATAGFKIPNDNNIACLDAGEIQFPLLLRKWKHGDYFYPLGMKKKKKLARFFIDQKLSKIEKENVRVIEMNKKIIWVAGMRIDERFKITERTKKVLKIVYQAIPR